MKPSQNPKDKGISPHLKEGVSPNTFPGSQLRASSELSREVPTSQTQEYEFETNIPHRNNPARTSSSDEAHQGELIEGHEEEGHIQDVEEEKLRSYADTEEDPEIKYKKRMFSKGDIDDEEENEREGSEHQERTPTNLISLSESLKAMKSLRSNFQSFELEMNARDFQRTPEGIYKEIDEEDYVKVESAGEEQLEEPEPNYEEYDKEEEENVTKVPRGTHNQFIEKINEEAHEESHREDEEEMEEQQQIKPHERVLEEETGVEETEKPQDIIGEETPKEQEGGEYLRNEALDENQELTEEKPENKEAEIEEKSKDVEEQEKLTGDILCIPKSPLEQQKEVLPEEAIIEKEDRPPLNIEQEKLKFLDELEYGTQPNEILPKETAEPITQKDVSNFTSAQKKEEEESVKEEPTKEELTKGELIQEEPPKFFSIPKRETKTDPKRVVAPFGAQKTNPFPAKKPFVETSSVQKSPEIVSKTIQTPELHPEFEKDAQAASENTLIIRLKQAEIELIKERKKNENLEMERERILTENKDLKKEVQEIRSKLGTLEKSRDAERLVFKEQETIDKLRAELKSTLEGSRLINEHSNRIINESGKFKQEMETMIDTLSEEKKDLQQSILQLKNLLNQEILKNETLTQRANLYEQRVKEYENSFDLVQKQFKERERTVRELTSLNDNSQNTLQSLPKVDTILAKLTPRVSSVSIQTASSELASPERQISQPRSILEPKEDVSSKFSSTRKDKPVIEKTEQAFPSQKNVFNLSKGKPEPTKFEVKLPPKQIPTQRKEETPKASEPQDNKSQTFDDDLNLLVDDNVFFSSTHTSQGVKVGLKTGAEEKLQLSKTSPKKEIKGEVKKPEPQHFFKKEEPEKKASPQKDLPQISQSQDLKSLLKEKEELPPKQSAGLATTNQWGFGDPDDIFTSLNESNKEKETKEKEAFSLKPNPSQNKPTSVKLPSAEEITKKTAAPLIISKAQTSEQEKTTKTKEKPGLVVNLSNIPNKSSSRYLPKKVTTQSAISSEADNFFDELGLSETPGNKGGNLLRESTTSIKSSTSKQGGNDPFSQPSVSQSLKKKGPSTNQFV